LAGTRRATEYDFLKEITDLLFQGLSFDVFVFGVPSHLYPLIVRVLCLFLSPGARFVFVSCVAGLVCGAVGGFSFK
jgi:hypothetical protein